MNHSRQPPLALYRNVVKHLKKLSHILIPVLILISPLGCGEVVKTYYESRTESLVFSDKNVKNDKCVLKREVHKHFIIYQYDCEVDSKSNLEFHFSIQSNLLTIGNTELNRNQAQSHSMNSLSFHLRNTNALNKRWMRPDRLFLMRNMEC